MEHFEVKLKNGKHVKDFEVILKNGEHVEDFEVMVKIANFHFCFLNNLFYLITKNTLKYSHPSLNLWLMRANNGNKCLNQNIRKRSIRITRFPKKWFWSGICQEQSIPIQIEVKQGAVDNDIIDNELGLIEKQIKIISQLSIWFF